MSHFNFLGGAFNLPRITGKMDRLSPFFPFPSQSPFEQLRRQMDDILGDGGVLKEVVQPGEGPPVPHNASVLSIYLFLSISKFISHSETS